MTDKLCRCSYALQEPHDRIPCPDCPEHREQDRHGLLDGTNVVDLEEYRALSEKSPQTDFGARLAPVYPIGRHRKERR